MTKELTFNDVIEAHRQEVGAQKVHVTPGDQATPEGLQLELSRIRSRTRLHGSFTDLEIEKAKVARLRGDFRRISKLCQRPIQPELDQAEVNRRLSEIFSISDMFTDVSLEVDIVWMADDRLKRGVALPEAVSQASVDEIREVIQGRGA